MRDRSGCTIISVVLGFGLATMFHRVCVGRECIVVTGPAPEELTMRTWRRGGECYTYSIVDTGCPEQATMRPGDNALE